MAENFNALPLLIPKNCFIDHLFSYHMPSWRLCSADSSLWIWVDGKINETGTLLQTRKAWLLVLSVYFDATYFDDTSILLPKWKFECVPFTAFFYTVVLLLLLTKVSKVNLISEHVLRSLWGCRDNAAQAHLSPVLSRPLIWTWSRNAPSSRQFFTCGHCSMHMSCFESNYTS